MAAFPSPAPERGAQDIEEADELVKDGLAAAGQLELGHLAVARAAAWTRSELDGSQKRIANVILDEFRRSQGETLVQPLPKDRRLRLVAQSLLDDPSDQRDLTAMGGVRGHVTPHLSRYFVAETGLSFADWRLRARLLRGSASLPNGFRSKQNLEP